MDNNYKDMTSQNYINKVDSLLNGMPDFCRTYCRARERRLAASTLYSYISNMNIFFQYLHDNNGYFGKKDITKITLDDMDLLTTEDIEEFLHFLKKQGVSNRSSGHYISALSTIYSHFRKKRLISNNPVEAIEREKLHSKEIIRLTKSEENKLMNEIIYGTNLTKREQIFLDKNRERDYAILKLFLNTGMRVSELVGLDIKDIKFRDEDHLDPYATITRKGGKTDSVYFSDSTEKALIEYYNIRKKQYKPDENEPAFFLAKTGKRISVRSIQKLVAKYRKAAIPDKDDGIITPHKLRSTYATNMLSKTGDIELVSEQLGHSTLNTVKVYAKHIDSKRAKVRNILE